VPETCTGGQGTVPYEQNTQQSPGFGRITVLQAVHAQKYTQASVGIGASRAVPQCGHVITDRRLMPAVVIPISRSPPSVDPRPWARRPRERHQVAVAAGGRPPAHDSA
jgi:hypothetical protein